MTKVIRRTVLRGLTGGAAVTVGLPFLNCFLNGNGTAVAATGTELPVCFGHWIQALGMNPGMWIPDRIGADYQNNIQLKLFDPFKDRINVFSGMRYFLDGRPHETHTSTVEIATTGAVFDSGPIGPSLDTRIADTISTRTRFRSLEVSLDGSRRSWSRRSGSSINPSEGSPLALYTRIFGPDFKDPNAADFTPDLKTIARRSVLSAVTDQRQSLMRQLDAQDRSRLDEFFTSIREVENKLDLEMQKPAPMPSCTVPASDKGNEPSSQVDDISVNSKLLARLMAHAMACGQTQVINVQVGSQGWRAKGSPYNWHSYTHEESIDPKLGYQAKVYGFTELANQVFVEFLRTLDGIKEGPSTLLDRSLILWQTDHGDARTHSVDSIPIFTAGSANGRVRTGLHISKPNEPCTRVGLTVQQVLGVPIEAWGNRSNETSRSVTEILA